MCIRDRYQVLYSLPISRSEPTKVKCALPSTHIFWGILLTLRIPCPFYAQNYLWVISLRVKAKVHTLGLGCLAGHLSPWCSVSLCSSHTGILAVLQTCQIPSYIKALLPAASLPEVPQISPYLVLYSDLCSNVTSSEKPPTPPHSI